MNSSYEKAETLKRAIIVVCFFILTGAVCILFMELGDVFGVKSILYFDKYKDEGQLTAYGVASLCFSGTITYRIIGKIFNWNKKYTKEENIKYFSFIIGFGSATAWSIVVDSVINPMRGFLSKILYIAIVLIFGYFTYKFSKEWKDSRLSRLHDRNKKNSDTE